MDFYYGLAQIVGVHTILGLSAYMILLTGQVSMAQAGFMSIGAYVAGMLTVLAEMHLIPAMIIAGIAASMIACIVGFPALRVFVMCVFVYKLAHYTWQCYNAQLQRMRRP